MEGNWIVYYDSTPVGECRIIKQGLYYRITCRCKRISDLPCRLYVSCNGVPTDLGILVPGDNALVTEKRIPVKSLPEGDARFSFVVEYDNDKMIERFIPVKSDAPLNCISELKNARFARRGEQIGLLIDSQKLTANES